MIASDGSLGLSLVAALDRIKLKSMPHQIVTKLLGNEMLKLFYFIIAKLDHATGLEVN